MANIDFYRANTIVGAMLGVNNFPANLANWMSLRLITATGVTASSWATAAGVNGTAGTGELAGTAGYATSGLTLNFGATVTTSIPPTSQGPTAAAGLSWTAGSTWLIQGFEIWDTATTRNRWWFGTFAGGTVTVANGQQLQIAQNAITVTLQ